MTSPCQIIKKALDATPPEKWTEEDKKAAKAINYERKNK